MERIARRAVHEFGGFDTWINAAAAGIYGTVEQVPVGDLISPSVQKVSGWRT